MLVGRYSDDKKTVFVTRVIAPTMKLSTRTGFERKVDGMEGMWRNYRKKDYGMLENGTATQMVRPNIVLPILMP